MCIYVSVTNMQCELYMNPHSQSVYSNLFLYKCVTGCRNCSLIVEAQEDTCWLTAVQV